jgi:branched-chain amino acid transport system substrate-binding protein
VRQRKSARAGRPGDASGALAGRVESVFAATALAVLSLVMLAGCGQTSSGSGSNIGSSNTAPTNQLTIYSSMPLQGGGRERSAEIIDGEKLALQESRGRVGKFKVSYVSLDDADPTTGSWTPGQVSANAKAAAADKTTIAYLGDWDSGATAVSLPIVNGANVLQVSPASPYVGLTQASSFAGKGEPERYYPLGRRTFGRLMPSDQVQARAAVAYLKAEHVSRLFVVRDREVFDADVGSIAAARGAVAGVRLVNEVGLSANPADDASLAQQVAASGAGAMLFSGAATPRAAQLLRAVHAAAPSVKLFCPYFVAEPDFLAQLGPAQRAIYITTPGLRVDPARPGVPRFTTAYRAAFGAAPGPYSLLGYEAMRLMLDLIRQARSHGNDRQSVVNRFFATRGRTSVLGPYSIQPDGDTTLSRYGGSRVRADRLVFDRLLIP